MMALVSAGIDHGHSEKLWGKAHKVPFISLQILSPLISPVQVFPEIMHFDAGP